jgi:type IV secretory pathway VirB3-like protein
MPGYTTVIFELLTTDTLFVAAVSVVLNVIAVAVLAVAVCVVVSWKEPHTVRKNLPPVLVSKD